MSSFFMPTPDIIATADPDQDSPLPFLLADYAGIWDKYYGGNFGTEVTGSVKIQCIDGGERERVTIKSSAKNAIGWVADANDIFANCEFRCNEADPNSFQKLVGDFPSKVAAGEAEGAFGTASAAFTFMKPAGAPFIDMVDLLGNRGATVEGYEIESVRFLIK